MSRRIFSAAFSREEDILAVTKAVRHGGYTIKEIYTPYAVHGLDKAQGLRPSRLPMACLLFGLFGATAKLWFQIWTSSQSWPVNVGGKPLVSVPAFVPVTFEITVLFAGLGTVATFLLISRLRPGKQVKTVHPRVTNDVFVLELLEDDAAFDVRTVTALCKEFNSIHVEERIEEDGR